MAAGLQSDRGGSGDREGGGGAPDAADLFPERGWWGPALRMCDLEMFGGRACSDNRFVMRLARHRPTGRTVLVKSAQLGGEQPKTLRELVSELRDSLGVPGVLAARGVVVSQGPPGAVHVVYESADLGSLRAVLKRHAVPGGRVPLPIVAEIGRQLLVTLRLLHAVHGAAPGWEVRRLSPEYILIKSDGTVLLDLLATNKVITAHPMEGWFDLVTDPEYTQISGIRPEHNEAFYAALEAELGHIPAGLDQALGRMAAPYLYCSPDHMIDRHDGGYDGAACDVWSLGIILLECALGCSPFAGPPVRAGEQKPGPPGHATGPPRSGWDVHLFRILLRMIDKDPMRRPGLDGLLSSGVFGPPGGAPSGMATPLARENAPHPGGDDSINTVPRGAPGSGGALIPPDASAWDRASPVTPAEATGPHRERKDTLRLWLMRDPAPARPKHDIPPLQRLAAWAANCISQDLTDVPRGLVDILLQHRPIVSIYGIHAEQLEAKARAKVLADKASDEAGATEDGADEDGADEDGADEDGADEDGADEDGANEDGADEDGADEDGANEDGADEDGANEDGAVETEAEADEAKAYGAWGA